jgi:hypothetical protein
VYLRDTPRPRLLSVGDPRISTQQVQAAPMHPSEARAGAILPHLPAKVRVHNRTLQSHILKLAREVSVADGDL